MLNPPSPLKNRKQDKQQEDTFVIHQSPAEISPNTQSKVSMTTLTSNVSPVQSISDSSDMNTCNHHNEEQDNQQKIQDTTDTNDMPKLIQRGDDYD